VDHDHLAGAKRVYDALDRAVELHQQPGIVELIETRPEVALGCVGDTVPTRGEEATDRLGKQELAREA
jgi:hypothetical protein